VIPGDQSEQRWAGRFGPVDDTMRLWQDCEAFVPQLALAERLDFCVDELAEWLEDQPGEQARETYLDLLVGFRTGADAMRALVRGDMSDCVNHLELAVHHLELVRALDIVIPDWQAHIEQEET
jgi:hypothetical protein